MILTNNILNSNLNYVYIYFLFNLNYVLREYFSVNSEILIYVFFNII